MKKAECNPYAMDINLNFSLKFGGEKNGTKLDLLAFIILVQLCNLINLGWLTLSLLIDLLVSSFTFWVILGYLINVTMVALIMNYLSKMKMLFED